jgi:hypothetical protein
VRPASPVAQQLFGRSKALTRVTIDRAVHWPGPKGHRRSDTGFGAPKRVTVTTDRARSGRISQLPRLQAWMASTTRTPIAAPYRAALRPPAAQHRCHGLGIGSGRRETSPCESRIDANTLAACALSTAAESDAWRRASSRSLGGQFHARRHACRSRSPRAVAAGLPGGCNHDRGHYCISRHGSWAARLLTPVRALIIEPSGTMQLRKLDTDSPADMPAVAPLGSTRRHQETRARPGCRCGGGHLQAHHRDKSPMRQARAGSPIATEG